MAPASTSTTATKTPATALAPPTPPAPTKPVITTVTKTPTTIDVHAQQHQHQHQNQHQHQRQHQNQHDKNKPGNICCFGRRSLATRCEKAWKRPTRRRGWRYSRGANVDTKPRKLEMRVPGAKPDRQRNGTHAASARTTVGWRHIPM